MNYKAWLDEVENELSRLGILRSVLADLVSGYGVDVKVAETVPIKCKSVTVTMESAKPKPSRKQAGGKGNGGTVRDQVREWIYLRGPTAEWSPRDIRADVKIPASSLSAFLCQARDAGELENVGYNRWRVTARFPRPGGPSKNEEEYRKAREAMHIKPPVTADDMPSTVHQD